MVCELRWFDIFDSFSLFLSIRLVEHLKQGFRLAYCSVLYESIGHTEDTVVRFGHKVCFEN